MSPSAVPKKRRTDSQSSQPAKKLKGHDVKGKAKLQETSSEFQNVSAALQVSVPPAFAQSPRVGVEQMLDSLVMRYIPSLEGVVIAHSDLEFTTDKARVKGDCPFLICDIKFEATVWRPCIGSKMKGRIILSSPDHISLLVHRTFNVSIPRHHIPSDKWEFEYGPAENDPEFAEEAEAVAEAEAEQTAVDGEVEEASTGKWVHRKSGERLGGESRTLEFTVIGLTVANEMLSLVGSIQKDPLSSKHQAFDKTDLPNEQAAADSDVEQPSEDEESDFASDDEEHTMQLLKRKAVPVVEEAPEKDKSSKHSKKKKRKTES